MPPTADARRCKCPKCGGEATLSGCAHCGTGQWAQRERFIDSPVHGIVRSSGPCMRCGIRAWRWHRPTPAAESVLICLGCDHTRSGGYYPCKISFTQTQIDGEGMKMKQLQRLEEHEHYDVWEEEHSDDSGSNQPPVKMDVARNKCGEYIGEKSLAEILCNKHGIVPEAQEEGGVCCFGWSESEQKYYGWSHRALVGFSIGDKIFDEDFEGATDQTLFLEHGSEEIKTKEDARKAAMAFAESVS